MKKISIFLILFFLVVAIPHVFAAQNFVPLAGIPGLTQNVPETPAGLAMFFNNFYKFLVGIAAVLAIIEIIWGGLEISTKDSVSKQSDGKNRITQAILGLVLVLSPVLVFSIINPSILNLSLNLPALGTASGTPTTINSGAQSVSDTTKQTNAPEKGCTTVTLSAYLETAVCASKEDAAKYSCKNGVLNPVLKIDQGPDYLETTTRVYCQTSSEVIYWKFGGVKKGVIPRDARHQSAFASTCSESGGIMKVNDTKFISIASISNCPPDSGLTEPLSACWDSTLTCEPK